uniref:Uncharacterized protein n=1 Tax=Strigamia maritima TaxID=126957 RepID=T1IKJ6_STRMM
MATEIVIRIYPIILILTFTKTQHPDCSRIPIINTEGLNASKEIHQLKPENLVSLSFHMTTKDDCTKPMLCKEEIKEMEKYFMQNRTGTWLQFYIDSNGIIHKRFMRSDSKGNSSSLYNISITLLGNYTVGPIPDKMMYIIRELLKCFIPSIQLTHFIKPRSLNYGQSFAKEVAAMNSRPVTATNKRQRRRKVTTTTPRVPTMVLPEDKDQNEVAAMNSRPATATNKRQRRRKVTTTTPRVPTMVLPEDKDQNEASILVPSKNQNEASHVVSSNDQNQNGASHVFPSKDQNQNGASHVDPSKDQNQNGASHVVPSKDQNQNGASHVDPSNDQNQNGASHVDPSNDQNQNGASHVVPSKDQNQNGASHVDTF